MFMFLIVRFVRFIRIRKVFKWFINFEIPGVLLWLLF